MRSAPGGLGRLQHGSCRNGRKPRAKRELDPAARALHRIHLMWNHWVARANHPYQPFQAFLSARASWMHLTQIFPELLSAVLMPNHLHLILPSTLSLENTRHRLHGWLSSISRREKIQHLWQSPPEPRPIPDRAHLSRQLRYVALNPCRKKLCQDPLEWPWSSYRELVGASADSPTRTRELSRALHQPNEGFERGFHRYVSSDPSVHVVGSRFPVGATPGPLALHSIAEILVASASALRLPLSAVNARGPLRSLFIHLAARHGWRRATQLAGMCRISAGRVHHILQGPPPPGITAAELCLGDRRLQLDRDLFDTNPAVKAVSPRGLGPIAARLVL